MNYLQALRDKDYLLFLQWPSALASKGDAADSILEQLTNEWLRFGYTPQDGKQVALLHRFSLEQSPYLSQDLQYAITTLSIAAMHCMVVEHGDSILFDHWSSECSANEIHAVLTQLLPMLQLRRHVVGYLEVLKKKNDEHDELLQSRVSMVSYLVHYVHGKTQVTADVRNEISIYINRIRELGSNTVEEEYLNAIDLLPQAVSSWRWLAKIGMSFFNLLNEQRSDIKQLETVSEIPMKKIEQL